MDLKHVSLKVMKFLCRIRFINDFKLPIFLYNNVIQTHVCYYVLPKVTIHIPYSFQLFLKDMKPEYESTTNVQVSSTNRTLNFNSKSELEEPKVSSGKIF